MKLSIKKFGLILSSIALLFLPASPVLAQAVNSPVLSSRPLFLLSHHTTSTTAALTQSTSENWSGYAATGANGSYTSVSSAWVQPSLTCSTKTASYSAFWVGLDGYSDQTVEQIGTEANCSQGKAQYSTWYEMYPQNPSELLTRLVVSPGDQVSASVTYTPPTTTKSRNFFGRTNNGSFTLSLNDLTTGKSYSTNQTTNRAANRSSAEVVAEAPYSNGILPLADFGTINFSESQDNGLALGNTAGLQQITMDDPHGMVATPSSFDGTGKNFSVTWSD